MLIEPNLVETLTAWRRHLHAHPELTLQEKETAGLRRRPVHELGVAVIEGVGGYGVVATLSRAGKRHRSVGLRATWTPCRFRR